MKVLQKLELDDVADHHCVRTAQDRRVDVVSHRGHERQEKPGEYPGDGQREDDAPEHLAPIGVQIPRRFHHASVDLLEGDVERQGHEGQEVVRDARYHGRRRGEEPEALWDQM